MRASVKRLNGMSLALTSLAFILASCAKTSVSRTDSTVAPTAVFSQGNDKYRIEEAPLWEATADGSHDWTQYAADVIDNQAPNLLRGTSDVKKFCPNYFAMSTPEKINFWVYLISGIAKYESGFNPTDRMKETGLGTDPITHHQVYSEGLLQLSYQDVIKYPYCDEFNWAADSKLHAGDPRKTILSPTKNLLCGIRILNQIVGERDKLAFSPGHYWSTLEPGHRNGKVSQLEKMTKQLSFCKN